MSLLLPSIGALFIGTVVLPGLLRDSEVYQIGKYTISSGPGGFLGHAHALKFVKETFRHTYFICEEELKHNHPNNNIHVMYRTDGKTFQYAVYDKKGNIKCWKDTNCLIRGGGHTHPLSIIKK